MLVFQEKQVQDFLLESQIEPLIAAQVAHSLNGVMSTAAFLGDGEVQFDGAVKASEWPSIYAGLSTVPSRLIQIDEVQSSAGQMIEFTVRINDSEMNEAEAIQAVSGLHRVYTEVGHQPTETFAEYYDHID